MFPSGMNIVQKAKALCIVFILDETAHPAGYIVVQGGSDAYWNINVSNVSSHAAEKQHAEAVAHVYINLEVCFLSYMDDSICHCVMNSNTELLIDMKPSLLRSPRFPVCNTRHKS